MSAISKLIGEDKAAETGAERLGAQVFDAIEVLRELAAFAVITLGVTITKFNASKRVVHPLIFAQIWNAGVRLLAMIGFIGAVFGLLIVGQMVGLLTKIGAQGYIGMVMVTVIVRELGPLLTALIVLARAGTSNVVELGTIRALGEVEALESLGIDPVHYLVMPRVIALSLSVFCLATYLVIIAIGSGYVFAFIQDVPLPFGVYLNELGNAVRWEDFVLFALKTILFGAIIAVVSCYHGLARPLRVEDVSRATARAVVESVSALVVLDALFLLGYVFG
jgi:phospholipid/cholesterol/gamma-HCH transport system permease protein